MISIKKETKISGKIDNKLGEIRFMDGNERLIHKFTKSNRSRYKFIFPILLSFFPFFTIQGVDLEHFYRIENDCLISAQGVKYPAISFSCQLHEDLAYTLKDPEQVQMIVDAYQKHIVSTLSDELVPLFSNALLKVCYFFGSQKYSPEKSLRIALEEEGIFPWLEENREAFDFFIHEANLPAHFSKPIETAHPFKIVILTTSASGGNESVTHGIVQFLSQFDNIEAQILDVETIAKDADPIMLATGYSTYDGLYTTIFQQAGDPDILIERDVLTKQIGKYIPSRLSSLLKEKIIGIQPDLIISTRNYAVNDMSLAALDIPLRILHCDYEVSFFFLDLCGKLHPDSVRFWLPSLQPHIFKPLFVKANRMDLYHPDESKERLMEKIALLTHTDVDDISKQFEAVGFPSRPEFFRIENPQELHLLRKKWDVKPDETPILVSMGKNGVASLENIFDQCIEIPSRQFKFIFICGKNDALKEQLQAKLALMKCHANRFKIYGFLPPQQMNELLNVCPVKITKPGGAISTEAMITGTYLLMISPHPWEEANAREVELRGMGQYYEADIPLLEQIDASCEKAKKAREKSLQLPPWKCLLMERLDLLQN